MTETNEPPVNFAALSETEQREVAERLIRLKESNWKPFWCPDPSCTGDPHPLLADATGAFTFVSESEVSTDARPLSDLVWETPGGDWVYASDGEEGQPGDTTLGRYLLDPNWSHNHARQDQRLPNWLKPWTLFIMSGRGSGKTRTGVEFVTLCARKGLDGAIVGRRGTELENTHVAALIEHAHPDFTPVYFASKDILVWPNEATTYLFSAERPENIRSVNLSYAWVDEAAWMDEIKKAWSNLKLATRIEKPGNPIHILITSTPTATPWVMEMEDDPNIEVRRVSTYANRKNLSTDFIRDLERDYEGTRIGRQELHGEVLRDVEGAYWNDDMFKHLKATDAANFEDILDSMDNRVLAIDPAGSRGPRSDATGLIVAGVQHTDIDGEYLSASQFFVLGDATLKGSPNEWAEQAYKIALQMRVSRIVVEKNFGADMVKQTLLDYAKFHPEARDENGEEYLIEEVHAEKSKETRAEPTVGKYEQGRVTHVVSPGVFGDMSKLEKEQTMWVPKSRGGRSPSPNRIDALVWAIRALEAKIRFEAQTANAADVMSRMTPASRPSAQSAPAVPAAKPRWENNTIKRVPPASAKPAGGPVLPAPKTPPNFPKIRKR